jgi:hypothetical protein
VPKGGIVATRGEGGPIGAVLDAVGEYRTHNMMSHGPGAYITHSTMHTPGTSGWPELCSTPARPSELEHGWPGMSQVNGGAIYQFVNGGGQPEYIRYQLGPAGSANRLAAEETADYAWYNVPYQWTASHQDGNAGFWSLGTAQSGSFQRYEYAVYQYRDVQGRHLGSDDVTNNGTQCTSADGYLYSKSHPGDYIDAYTYSHSQIVAAANNLYQSVKDDCSDGLGFWGGFGAGAICFEFNGVCDDAGRQVRNCFAAGRCDTDSDSVWNNIANDATATATSISPDDFLGWSGHAFTGEHVGPWAPYGTNTVTWNSGGNVYGCWF